MPRRHRNDRTNPYVAYSDAELWQALMAAAGVVKRGTAGMSPEAKGEVRERLRLLLIAAAWRVEPMKSPPPLGNVHPDGVEPAERA